MVVTRKRGSSIDFATNDLSWAVIVIAPLIGSFLGVVVLRLPKGESIITPRSRCPQCGTRLNAADLIPLLSWLMRRRHCRHCGNAISAFYPAIEIGATAVALWAWVATAGWSVLLIATLGWILLTLAVIDHRDGILPNGLVALLFVAGLAAIPWSPPGSPLDHALGAVAGFGVMAVIAVTYKRLRGVDGLGWGDAKFMAAAGLWVGWQGVWSVLLIASASALLVVLASALRGTRLTARTPLAFGPYLCFGMWLVVLYGPIGL